MSLARSVCAFLAAEKFDDAVRSMPKTITLHSNKASLSELREIARTGRKLETVKREHMALNGLGRSTKLVREKPKKILYPAESKSRSVADT